MSLYACFAWKHASRHIGLFALATFFLLAAGLRTHSQEPPPAADAPLVWPNAQSKANSDDWIRLHHQQIRQMQPRLLVLNFVNGLSTEEATKKTEALIAAVRESSRYHGYQNPKATPFFDYKIAKVVDLTDAQPLPDDARFEGNSSKYPRVPGKTDGINFQYGELFGDKFAEYYHIPNPDNPNQMLNLQQLVNRGLIHEVWFLANQGKFGSPYECLEVKQAYDENLRKIPGRFVQAGLGASEEEPFLGRSLRILFINAERGPGCALESLGHGLEGTATANAIPYFTRYFSEYAGFDLKKRYRMPFDRMYERNGIEFDYPDDSTLTYVYKGERKTVHPYTPIGGSVHFTPTARRDNDLENQTIVLSTIEHYRRQDGQDGKDRADPWSNAKFARYRALATDCSGPWVVYWRQNMPGLDNVSKEDNGRPMLNWWPFLFY